MSRFFALAIAAVVALSGCALRGKGTLYVEPSSRGGPPGQVRRIAVVPNRLPTMLTDPEKWRRYNFRLLEQYLRRNGFDVVDYESSVRAFEQSGMPVEDTRSSRDKYADLAASLGVDAIVIPYYGTFAASTSAAMVITSSYNPVATLQLYSAQKNDFTMRIDANGQATHTTGILRAIGVNTTVVGAGVSLGAIGCGAPCAIAGSVLSIVGSALNLFDLFITAVLPPFSQPAEAHWERAFGEAIRQGLKPMYAAMGIAPAPTTRSRAVATPPPPAPYAPPAAPPPQSAPASGCTSNIDCKFGRVCVRGACATP